MIDRRILYFSISEGKWKVTLKQPSARYGLNEFWQRQYWEICMGLRDINNL